MSATYEDGLRRARDLALRLRDADKRHGHMGRGARRMAVQIANELEAELRSLGPSVIEIEHRPDGGIIL